MIHALVLGIIHGCLCIALTLGFGAFLLEAA